MIRYRTRDLTRLLPGTARTMRRMQKITGRTDDMIILRGVNLFPTQIEELIMGMPGAVPALPAAPDPGRPDGPARRARRMPPGHRRVPTRPRRAPRCRRGSKNTIGVTVTTSVEARGRSSARRARCAASWTTGRASRQTSRMTDDDLPISYQAAVRGTPVLSSSGATIGTLEHVLEVPEVDVFDGIVIATDGGLRFIDADQVLEITRSHIRSTVDDAQASQLPPPDGPPVYRVDALADSGRSLHDRLGRLFRRPHWIREDER